MDLIELRDQINTIDNSNFVKLMEESYRFLSTGNTGIEIDEIAKSVYGEDFSDSRPPYHVCQLIVNEVCLSALLRLGSFLAP